MRAPDATRAMEPCSCSGRGAASLLRQQQKCHARTLPRSSAAARRAVLARGSGDGPGSRHGHIEMHTLVEEVGRLRLEIQALKHQLSKQAQVQQDTKRKMTREDYECLPHRIIIMRHGESQGNVEKNTYCTQPDHSVPLTEHGRQQAHLTGKHLRAMLEEAHNGPNFNTFFMTSPYARTLETTDAVMEAFECEQVVGLRQAVQLREQDFGNFQDPLRINQDLCDRNKFGRFWFRFPNGESGADVYDRLTIFEDHLTRDMFMGRFADTSLVLVTHGLTLRIFLMRWFHWSVDEFLQVYNPANCDPVVVEKLPWETVVELQNQKYAHAKHVYYITPSSMAKLRGCEQDMCSYLPRHSGRIKAKWKSQRNRFMALRALHASMEGDSGMLSSVSHLDSNGTPVQLEWGVGDDSLPDLGVPPPSVRVADTLQPPGADHAPGRHAPDPSEAISGGGGAGGMEVSTTAGGLIVPAGYVGGRRLEGGGNNMAPGQAAESEAQKGTRALPGQAQSRR